MCWTYFHRAWPAILLLLGRIRQAYTVADSSQQRRKGWRFIHKEKNPRNLKALKCRWWCGENHFLSFFPFLYSTGTEMTAAGRSGSTKVQWRRRTGMHIKDSRLECIHTFLSLFLSLIYSHADVHTPLTDSYPPDKRPFLICVTIRADGPLFARGSLELLPFE